TTTSNEALATLTCASVAVHATVRVPTANAEPDAGTQTTVTSPSTMSIAVGAAHVATAPVGPVASTVMVGGTPLTTGRVVSVTRTSKVASPIFSRASAAEHVTRVGPTANVVPDAGAQSTPTGPSTMSVAVGVSHTATAPVGPV